MTETAGYAFSKQPPNSINLGLIRNFDNDAYYLNYYFHKAIYTY